MAKMFASLGAHVAICGRGEDKLEKAVVEIKELGLKFITDLEGHYHFYELCAGNYTIVVNHTSCDSIVLKTTVQRNLIKNYENNR